MAHHIQALLELACPQRQAPASLLVAPNSVQSSCGIHSCSCKVGATSIYLSLFLSLHLYKCIYIWTYNHVCVYVCTSVFHNLYVDIHTYIYICITVYLCIGFSGSWWVSEPLLCPTTAPGLKPDGWDDGNQEKSWGWGIKITGCHLPEGLIISWIALRRVIQTCAGTKEWNSGTGSCMFCSCTLW